MTKPEYLGETLIRTSKVPLDDQLFMAAAVRRLDVDYARTFFLKHLPQFAQCDDGKILAILHAARYQDKQADGRLRRESEEWLRARGMMLPTAPYH